MGWEYLELRPEWRSAGGAAWRTWRINGQVDDGLRGSAPIEVLNVLGCENWELVAVVGNEVPPDGSVYVMKRPT